MGTAFPYSSDCGGVVFFLRWSGAALCPSFIAAAAAQWACVVVFSGKEYIYPVLRGEVASDCITSITLHHTIMVVVQYLSKEVYFQDMLLLLRKGCHSRSLHCMHALYF